MRVLMKWKRALVALALVLGLGITAAACDSGPPSAQQQDAERSAQSTSKIIDNQPVAAGKYSPARDNLNAWVNTYMSGPGKKYYVYFFIPGQKPAYYVLAGPPSSYAVGSTSPYHIECPYDGSSGGCTAMPNPGQDATFANQGTGQFQFYGRDATTQRVLEWGGVGITWFGADHPLAVPGAEGFGDTK